MSPQCLQNRNVYSRFLNVLTVSAFFTSDGKLFHARGAAIRKARSPRQRRLRKTNKSLLSTERKVTWRSRVETGCSMSVMWDGARPFSDWYTKRQSFNSIRAATGNQWSPISASVTWSRGRRPQTTRTAALRTCWSGAMVDYGRPESTALQ